jgi:ribonuclease J
MPAGKLQIVPLGGLGEFGMNCMAVRWNDDIIVIDAGMMFPEGELLGVDVVVPDLASSSPTGMRITSALCPGCSRR